MENSININFVQLFQLITLLLTGLLAGLFYGYDCSVIKGLGNLQNDTYLQSFQSINKAIQTPYFFISFMGSVLALPVSSWLSYRNYNVESFYLMLAASLVYFIGVFGVTVFCNVPLNEQLANFSISSATEIEIKAMRKAFEKPWNDYHTLRTDASIVAFCFAILSLLTQKK
ncbi:MAG: anthrone oxygenase family protein [Bacteroidota bacterium]